MTSALTAAGRIIGLTLVTAVVAVFILFAGSEDTGNVR
jgi:hypothetical protein